MTGRIDGAPAWRTARAAALLSAVCAAVLLTGACATNTVPYDTTPPADAAPAAPDEGPAAEEYPLRAYEHGGELHDEWADSCPARVGEADDTPDSTLTAYSIGGEIRTIDPGETCTEPDFGRSAGEKLHVCCDGTWQPL